MKRYIQIKDSYVIWHPGIMKLIIWAKLKSVNLTPKKYAPYIIEWWLHNIGYYLTKPFVSIPKIKRINERCRHVDLLVKGENK